MRPPFTEDFFKNLIGFATILIIGIGVTAFAGGGANQSPQVLTSTQTAHTQ